MRANYFSCALTALALAFGAGASAIESGIGVQGRPYISGGVSDEELQSLFAQRQQYSLWVITAAKGSGAHLADARVKISDAKRRVVFETRLDGPWLMIDLPLGRYEIEASFESETQKKVTTIHRNDHHQALFYFNSNAVVSPDGEKSNWLQSKGASKQ